MLKAAAEAALCAKYLSCEQNIPRPTNFHQSAQTTGEISSAITKI